MRQKVPSPAVQSTEEVEDNYDDDTDEDDDDDDDDDEEEDEQSHFSEGQLVPASSQSDTSEISEDIVEGRRALQCLYILLPCAVGQVPAHTRTWPNHKPFSGRFILFEASDKNIHTDFDKHLPDENNLKLLKMTVLLESH